MVTNKMPIVHAGRTGYRLHWGKQKMDSAVTIKASDTGTSLPRVLRPDLSGLLLPESSPHRRDMPLPAARRDEKYIANFDTRTLVYDAVQDAERISLFCPRLLNLWPLLRDGLRLDGAPVRVRRHRFLRFERLDLPKGAIGSLTVEIDGQVLSLDVHPAASDLFAGLDAMIAMVKDTPAQWIIDWANYHVSAHGAQGLVLLDNGSDAGLMDETVARLTAETTLTRVVVVSAPFPYGGKAGGRFIAPAKYLQVAMLNLMRARFLGQARGILSVDVDEFVKPLPRGDAQQSVFDLARASRFGCVTFLGAWAFAQDTTGPQLQRDHTHTDPDRPCAIPKWCMVPGGWADRFPLAVHRPAGPLLALTRSKQTEYWHFSPTNTGWKNSRFKTGAKGSSDTVLVDALQNHLLMVVE